MARDHRARGTAHRGPPRVAGPERSRLRRDRPLTWRSAVLFVVPLTLLAVGVDTAFVTAAMTKCPGCGGHHVPLDITLTAFGLTSATVWTCVASWRELRRTPVGGKHPTKPTGADPKRQER